MSADARWEYLQGKAIEEGLTPAEVSEVVDALGREPSYVNTISLLIALGEGAGASHAPLVENFLRPGVPPGIGAVALRVLCIDWDLTPQYMDLMKRLLHGVDWDTTDELRLEAMGCAGYFLRSHFDGDLLSSLIGIAESEDERPLQRASALHALGVVLGDRWVTRGAFSLAVLENAHRILPEARSLLAQGR